MIVVVSTLVVVIGILAFSLMVVVLVAHHVMAAKRPGKCSLLTLLLILHKICRVFAVTRKVADFISYQTKLYNYLRRASI